MDIWQTLLYLFLGLIGGLVGGFFLSRWYFKRELAKNPPINEKMIRAMFMSMGRKPNEAQVRAVINSMNAQK
ncbi:MAG: hypothetical protein RL379_770 [Bacillota bacterium]|jgi:uncharacterized protein YneF (UPF0154 family)